MAEAADEPKDEPKNTSGRGCLIGIGIAAVVVVLSMLAGDDNSAEPSPEAVLDMSCPELQRAWQSHRRGEWDAPGTFRLLTEEIDAEC